MPETVIISNKKLPVPERRGNFVRLPLSNGMAIKVPSEIADAPWSNDKARAFLDSLILDGDDTADAVRLWLLFHELRMNDKTLGQAADNQGALKDMIETSTYRVVRTDA